MGTRPLTPERWIPENVCWPNTRQELCYVEPPVLRCARRADLASTRMVLQIYPAMSGNGPTAVCKVAHCTRTAPFERANPIAGFALQAASTARQSSILSATPASAAVPWDYLQIIWDFDWFGNTLRLPNLGGGLCGKGCARVRTPDCNARSSVHRHQNSWR